MNGVAFTERAAFFRPHETLVVADLHLGRDESSAVSFPLGEREELTDRIESLFTRFNPATLVVAGDVVHTFSEVSERSRETLAALRETCALRDVALELVAGNHDTALESAWDGPLREAVVLEEPTDGGQRPDGGADNDPLRTVVCHGHEPPSITADRYVIGHVHPTLEIEGDRRPCFLHGEGAYRGADLLVLPAFTRLAPGVAVNDMRTDAFGSPLITDADRLAPIVFDPAQRESLRFPPLGAFRRLL